MNDIAATLARGHALNHKNALEAVGALDDLQLRWRPVRSNSIGFNLWHMARWAREGVAKRWRFPTEGLGNVETGTGRTKTAPRCGTRTSRGPRSSRSRERPGTSG